MILSLAERALLGGIDLLGSDSVPSRSHTQGCGPDITRANDSAGKNEWIEDHRSSIYQACHWAMSLGGRLTADKHHVTPGVEKESQWMSKPLKECILRANLMCSTGCSETLFGAEREREADRT